MPRPSSGGGARTGVHDHTNVGVVVERTPREFEFVHHLCVHRVGNVGPVELEPANCSAAPHAHRLVVCVPMDDHLPQTIPGLVDRAAAKFATREALVEGDLRLTFPELRAAVQQAARALVASGIEPGDRVAIWAPNCAEWAIAALGIISAGGVLVPINTRFKGNEARYVLDRADAKMLFTVSDFLDANYVELLRAEEPVPSLREVIDLRTQEWDAFLARDAGAALPEVKGDDLYAILFTSGTTGRPKGAMLEHEAAVRAPTTRGRPSSG